LGWFESGYFVVSVLLSGSLSELCRRQIRQRAMRSASVVVLPPRFKFFPRIFHREEQVGVEAFVSQSPVEALDEPVLHRFAGTDEVEFDPVFIGPATAFSAWMICSSLYLFAFILSSLVEDSSQSIPYSAPGPVFRVNVNLELERC
jgi:hypothetical protein